MGANSPQTVIAIDGPAASGKSSVAKRLAAQLGCTHVNSGSFYRIATWWLLQEGVDVESADAVAKAFQDASFASGFAGDEAFFHINGKDGSQAIHDCSVNNSVSPVARVAEVRAVVTEHLRQLAKERSLVVEGRDIGSVVFPATPYKFYVDASPEVRQSRRSAQGQNDEVAKRDQIDSTRTHAPLVTAEDAIVIDSTHMGIEEVAAQIILRLKLAGYPPLLA